MHTLTLVSLISMLSPTLSLGANRHLAMSRVDFKGTSPAKQKFAILKEPRFHGNILLMAAGASSVIVLGSGIALSALYPRHITRCGHRDGGYHCRTIEIFHPEWFGWLSGSLFVGAHLSTALGITGGILRARYDAWRIHKGLAGSLRSAPYVWAGTILTVASAAMLGTTVATLGLWIRHPSKFMIPLVITTGVLSGSGGLTMLSYGLKVRKYVGILDALSVVPLGNLQSRTTGLSLVGRF